MATCVYSAATSPRKDRERSASTEVSPEEKAVSSEALASLYRHCHDPSFDLQIITRFTGIVLAKAECPALASLLPRGDVTPDTYAAIRLILRCLRMLHLCGYEKHDLEVTMAHAAVYLEEYLCKLKKEGETMHLRELSLVVCVHVFIAHSYILDTNCPLRIWHQHIFAQFCQLNTLNAAVMRLMEQRGFILRVDPDALDARLSYLQDGCADGILSENIEV